MKPFLNPVEMTGIILPKPLQEGDITTILSLTAEVHDKYHLQFALKYIS